MFHYTTGHFGRLRPLLVASEINPEIEITKQQADIYFQLLRLAEQEADKYNIEQRAVGIPKTPTLIGNELHYRFKDEGERRVKAGLLSPRLEFEQAFADGEDAIVGTLGSVRTDVILRTRLTFVEAIYDYQGRRGWLCSSDNPSSRKQASQRDTVSISCSRNGAGF